MDLIYEEIKSDLKINQVVLMLHGYGADAKDFLSLANYWHRFLPNTLFVAPNAPKKCQINSAGYEWFDLMQTDKNKTTKGIKSNCPASIPRLKKSKDKRILSSEKPISDNAPAKPKP